MAHKEELERDIMILERNIESPVFQCDSMNAMLSRSSTKNNYEAFITNEISKEDLKDNDKRIETATRKFIEMCSCMRI